MTEEILLIRRLTAGAAAAAVALEKDSPGAWSAEALAAELHRPGGWQYVGFFQRESASRKRLQSGATCAAKDLSDDQADKLSGDLLPVCYACGHVVDQEAELYRIAVTAGRRRQGLGALFLSYLLRSLARNGVTSCWLEVRASNTAALGLYHKLGFTKETIRKKYYADPPEDAIIMQWHPEAP